MTKPSDEKDRLTRKRRARLSVLERVDIAALETMRPLIESRWGRRLGALGNLADEPPMLGLSAGMVLAGVIGRTPRLRRAGMRMLAAHGIAIALKELGKNNIDRSRPDALLRKNRYRMRLGHSRDAKLRSFPSGHTAAAIALAGAMSREYPKARGPAYLAAAVMGGLQVLRRAHFPGDVAAGALLGMAARMAGNVATDALIHVAIPTDPAN